MPENHTLHSRLRVLIAKSFRAEKLYSSLRSPDASKRSGSAPLAEMANDVRAREWQRAHYDLRTALNDILAEGGTRQIVAEVCSLRARFQARFDEDRVALERGIGAVSDSAGREEFAYILKLALDLIRQKARSQASKAVADELGAILSAIGLTDKQAAAGGNLTVTSTVVADAVEAPTAPTSLPSNVVMLRRRAG